MNCEIGRQPLEFWRSGRLNDERAVPNALKKSGRHKRKAPSIHALNVQIVVLPGLNQFDLAAIADALETARNIARRAIIKWQLVGLEHGSIECSAGTSISIFNSIDDVSAEHTVFLLGGHLLEASSRRKLVDWLQNGSTGPSRPIAIGGASEMLAAEGYQFDAPVAVHWAAAGRWKHLFPQVDHCDGLFSVGQRAITASGGRSSIDLAIHILKTHFGPEISRAVADQFNCERIRTAEESQRTGAEAAAESGSKQFQAAIRIMSRSAKKLMTARQIASEINVSYRQLQRLFKRHGKDRPMKHLSTLKAEHGRFLLWHTSLTIAEVSAAVGFSTPSLFGRHYKLRFGVAPGADRRSP